MTTNKLLQDLSKARLKGSRVLLRLDLNVPIHNGVILDDTRLKGGLRSINYLLERGAQVIVVTHLGRPEGRWDEKYSLKIIREGLRNLGLKCCLEERDIRKLTTLINHPCTLLENIRFYEEEMQDDPTFARHLAQFADLYVNDAFSASHRQHASISAITQCIPSYLGLEFATEVNALEAFMNGSYGKVGAIIGGSKISTKMPVLEVLSQKVDYIIPAGGIANTFLLALGLQLGESLVEQNAISQAGEFLAREMRAQLLLPQDVVVVSSADREQTKVKLINELETQDIVLDLGPLSVAAIASTLQQIEAVLWNGPLGFYEDERFRVATHGVARTILQLTRDKKLTSVIGGGDLGAALKSLGKPLDFTYVSTSGGAFLEFIAKG